MSDVRDTVAGIWDRMTRKKPRAPVDERAASAKAAAKKIAQPLPEVVFPHEGLKEDARRKAMIDALLERE